MNYVLFLLTHRCISMIPYEQYLKGEQACEGVSSSVATPVLTQHSASDTPRMVMNMPGGGMDDEDTTNGLGGLGESFDTVTEVFNESVFVADWECVFFV